MPARKAAKPAKKKEAATRRSCRSSRPDAPSGRTEPNAPRRSRRVPPRAARPRGRRRRWRSGPGSRRSNRSRESEPIDLLAYAGPSVLKRVRPLVPRWWSWWRCSGCSGGAVDDDRLLKHARVHRKNARRAPMVADPVRSVSSGCRLLAVVDRRDHHSRTRVAGPGLRRRRARRKAARSPCSRPATCWSTRRSPSRPTKDGAGARDFSDDVRRGPPTVEAADLAICHLEVPLANADGPFTGFPTFSAPPEVATALAATGYDTCSTASNHTFDQGAEGAPDDAGRARRGRRSGTPARRAPRRSRASRWSPRSTGSRSARCPTPSTTTWAPSRPSRGWGTC